MSLIFFPDLPIENLTDDELGFCDFAQAVQSAVYHTQPPFVYGILGEWGTGKTSILNLLSCLLEQELKNGTHPFVPIRFNAWKYENEANLIYPLLHAIRQDYARRIPGMDQTFITQFKNFVYTSALALTDLGLRAATHAVIGEGITLKDLSDNSQVACADATQLETILSGWADRIDQLETAFHELLALYARNLVKNEELCSSYQAEDIRFVILVDDLDRCLPISAITILENIKNFLTVDNCIFILALNPQVVAQGIRIKFNNAPVSGRSYLEKILNYSFYVPQATHQRITRFGVHALKQAACHITVANLEKQIQSFGLVLQECRFNNPRKIKRILNHYLFLLERFISAGSQEDWNEIDGIRLIILAEYFPDLFRILTSDNAKAAQALQGIGTANFDFHEYESQYGIQIKDDYSQLIRFRLLFQFNNTDPVRLRNIAEIVQLVVQST